MSKKGFTLIELLVVIAVIALLLAILLPALNKVKMQAKTVVCTVNCRSLATAWGVYAMENADAIMSSYTGYSTFGNWLGKVPLLCANPWTGWTGYSNESDTIQQRERQAMAIEQGKLYPYVETLKVYRCPASKKHEIRGFSIPDILGPGPIEGHVTLGGLELVLKMSQAKSPASRIVFLDEGYATFGGYTIYYSQPMWWDVPPIRHNNGITLGYIDGHAEFYKWRDERTIKAGEAGNSGGTQADNSDLMMMQRGIFGSLGY